MATLAGSWLMMLLLLGQTGRARPITGTLIDQDGTPVAGAEVRLSCEMAADGTVPTLESIRTDREGRFRLAVPTRDRLRGLSWYGAVWAYRPGSALTVADVTLMQKIDQAPLTLRLRAAAPRTLTVRGRDGKPVAGARVTLRSIHGAAAPRHPAPAPRRAGPTVLRHDRRRRQGGARRPLAPG